MSNPIISNMIKNQRGPKTYSNRDRDLMGNTLESRLTKWAIGITAAAAIAGTSLMSSCNENANATISNKVTNQPAITQTQTGLSQEDKQSYMAIAKINAQIDQLDNIQDKEEDKLESIIKSYRSNGRDASRLVFQGQRTVESQNKRYFSQVEDITDDITKHEAKAADYRAKAEAERNDYMSDLSEVVAENKSRLAKAETKRDREQLEAGFDTVVGVINTTRDIRRVKDKRNADVDDYLRGAKRVVRDAEDIEEMWYKANQLNVRLKSLPSSSDVIKYEAKALSEEAKVDALEDQLKQLNQTYGVVTTTQNPLIQAKADQSQLNAVYLQNVNSQELIIQGLEQQMNELRGKKADIIMTIDNYNASQVHAFERYMK